MINFVQVEQSVKALKKQLDEGQVDEKTFEEQLLQLIDIAEDGHYWMFGHKSEQWFRHDGEKWVREDPASRFGRPVTGHMSLYPGDRPAGNGDQWQNPTRSQAAGLVGDWGWIILSLVLLVVVGAVIYYSAMP